MRRQTERGYTLSEIMMAASLLLTIMVLVSAPIMLTTRAMNTGQAHLDSQHQAREPVDRMLNDLRNGFGISFSATDANGCNTVTVYDSADRLHFKMIYSLDFGTHRIMKETQAWAQGTPPNATYNEQFGGAQVFANGIALLAFQPDYEIEASPGAFGAYRLPAPDASATSTFPPRTKNPLPIGTLVLIHVTTVASADSAGLDMTTSFYVRN